MRGGHALPHDHAPGRVRHVLQLVSRTARNSDRGGQPPLFAYETDDPGLPRMREVTLERRAVAVMAAPVLPYTAAGPFGKGLADAAVLANAVMASLRWRRWQRSPSRGHDLPVRRRSGEQVVPERRQSEGLQRPRRRAPCCRCRRRGMPRRARCRTSGRRAAVSPASFGRASTANAAHAATATRAASSRTNCKAEEDAAGPSCSRNSTTASPSGAATSATTRSTRSGPSACAKTSLAWKPTSARCAAKCR